jgi:capsular polysaccharide biosynthesis protein
MAVDADGTPAQAPARPLVTTSIGFMPLAPLPGQPTRLVAAPDVPPEVTLAFQQLLRRYDRLVLNAVAPTGTVLEDIFINRHGQIWDAEGNLVRRSAIPLAPESLRAMATAPVVDDLAFGRGGEANRNFFHWIAETLPSLSWCMDAEHAPMPVGISIDAPRFVLESLALASRHAFSVVPVGDAIRVRRLHMMSITVWSLAFRNMHAAMFDRMIQRSCDTAADPPASDKLYISRGDAMRRPMGNEAVLEKSLESRGFLSVAMGRLPLARQIALVRAARHIVAPHGAGLSHLIFAAPGCQVTEIFPASIGMQAARVAMTRISRVFGHHHTVWLEAGHAEEGRRWNVRIPPLLRHIDAT